MKRLNDVNCQRFNQSAADSRQSVAIHQLSRVESTGWAQLESLLVVLVSNLFFYWTTCLHVFAFLWSGSVMTCAQRELVGRIKINQLKLLHQSHPQLHLQLLYLVSLAT